MEFLLELVKEERKRKEEAFKKIQNLEKELDEAKLLSQDVLDQCNALQKRHMPKTLFKDNVRPVLERQFGIDAVKDVALDITPNARQGRGLVVCDCGDCEDYVEESYDTPDRIVNPGFIEQDQNQVD